MLYYDLHDQGDQPIYKRLCDAILSDIRSGKLPADSKLPTIRELAERLDLARGTVSRAYEELERLGAIRLTQGRGTFVNLRDDRGEGRKERAMAAIDNVLDSLDELGFSHREAEIFFSLKMRERIERDVQINALLLCTPDMSERVSQLLSKVEGAFITVQGSADLSAPEIEEVFDLVLATEDFYGKIERLLPRRMIMQVALALTERTILRMGKIKAQHRVGILSASHSMSSLMRKVCRRISPEAQIAPPFEYGKPLKKYLESIDVLLVGDRARDMLSSSDNTLLDTYAGVRLISCNPTADRGTLLAFSERVEQVKRRWHNYDL